MARIHSDEDTGSAERDEPRRARGGVAATAALWLLSLPVLVCAVLTASGTQSNVFTVALVALTPYVGAAGLALTVVQLGLRRWLTAIVTGVAAISLAAGVVPRAMSGFGAEASVSGGGGASPRLTVLSVNLSVGEADPQRIVDLVRDHQVDVLSVQELTPQGAAALGRAGLNEALPHQLFEARPGASGSGIASRAPLQPLELVPESTFAQPSALVEVPGTRGVEVVSVHPLYPVGRDTTGRWAADLAGLPPPTSGDAKPRVLAGDFNATLDHGELGELLGRGYGDVAATLGHGLSPTWPSNGKLGPLVNLDHVLFSGGSGPLDYRVFDVPGTDHRAVLSALSLT